VPVHAFEFDRPERFVAGTVGEPGQRTFYLQVRDGHRITSVALEKTQVALLADKLEELLDEVVRRSGGTADVPAVAPHTVHDLGPLELPLEEEFRVAVLGLRWDDDGGVVELEAASAVDDADADDPDEIEDLAALLEGRAATERGDPGADDADAADAAPVSVLRVRLTGAAARAFSARARAVVAAGRPACPLCTQPLDPQGHVCPRQNGYRRGP
jgi:uncharacterized repeat protein (TIGR03847 family)